MKTFLKIIQIAILSLILNGEYLAHGLGILTNRELLFFYFLFATLLYLVKTKLKFDYKKLFILGTIIGLTIEGIVTKSIFYPEPLVIMGINPLIIIQQTLAWGLLATALPIYLTEKQKIDKTLLFTLFFYILSQIIIKTFFTGLTDLFYFFSVIIVSVIILKGGYIKNKL